MRIFTKIQKKPIYKYKIKMNLFTIFDLSLSYVYLNAKMDKITIMQMLE